MLVHLQLFFFFFFWIWKPVVPLNCCFVVFVCLFVTYFCFSLDFCFTNICWVPTRARYVSEHWGHKNVWNTRVQCSVLSSTIILYWSMATFLKDTQLPRLGNNKHCDPTLSPKQNKTKKVSDATEFSSFAIMRETCPKTKAVKIKLPAIWPLAHRGQSSLCLVSSDNCYDPALTGKPHLAHYHFLNDAIWKGQTRFLA